MSMAGVWVATPSENNMDLSRQTEERVEMMWRKVAKSKTQMGQGPVKVMIWDWEGRGPVC